MHLGYYLVLGCVLAVLLAGPSKEDRIQGKTLRTKIEKANAVSTKDRNMNIQENRKIEKKEKKGRKKNIRKQTRRQKKRQNTPTKKNTRKSMRQEKRKQKNTKK